MKKVQVTLWNHDTKQNEDKEATFLHWGVSHEELNNGIGHYTVVFVMLSDGTVKEVYPTNIRFEVDDKKQKLEAAALDLLKNLQYMVDAWEDVRISGAKDIMETFTGYAKAAIKKATE